MEDRQAADESPQGNNGVDVEALIHAFLQDESQTSLELPTSLGADQRKQARRLVDQHPEIELKSYGFGSERQLHLFKKQREDAVRVKNTFIDDWVPAGGADEATEPLCFRSMPAAPVGLLERTLQRCLVVQNGGDTQCGAAEAFFAASTEESSGAELPQIGSSPASCSASNGPALPAMPEGLQVRNTFIHIESVPVVERAVQSMPDGMFRQQLQAELAAQARGEHSSQAALGAVHEGGNPTTAVSASSVPCAHVVAAVDGAAAALPDSVGAPPASAAPTEGDFLASGTEVVIDGLTKLPDFNGRAGVVQSLDAETGRYNVLLDVGAGTSGWKWVKVKGENLRPAMPPPPCNEPTLSLDCLPLDGQADSGDATRASATPLKLNALV